MSCDLLENAKQGYKMANGTTTLEPTTTDEVVTVPKTVENNSLEQVFLSYTQVRFFAHIHLDFVFINDDSGAGRNLFNHHESRNLFVSIVFFRIFRHQSNVKNPQLN